MLNILSHGAAALITSEGEQLKYPPDGDIVALILVLVVIAAFAVVMFIRNRKPAEAVAEEPVAVPAAELPKAPGSAGQLKLHDVEPKTAAMIMAIVADKMGKPLNELRFLSIKEVK